MMAYYSVVYWVYALVEYWVDQSDVWKDIQMDGQ